MFVPRSGVWSAIAVFCIAGSAYAEVADLSLIQAVKRDDASAVKTLLSKKGAAVNAAEADGSTALHWATQHNSLEIANLLLAAGANVSAATRYNVTPLAIAATNGNAAMIKRLIDAGADPNSTSREGETVLMTAALNGKADAVQALLAGGAKVNAVEPRKGQTAIMWAAGGGNDKAIETLVEFGANVNAKSKDGFTAFLFAVRNDKIDAARALLAHGANVNDVAPDGSSALNVAVVNAYYDLASVLLDYKADPNLPDPRGSPLLTIAWLDKPGSTFEAAGNAEQAVTAPRPTGKVTPLELAQKLLDHGCNPNTRYAGKEGRLNKSFLSARNPPDVPLGRHFQSFRGATAYYVAARNGDAPLMQVLIKGGADPKIYTEFGVTPLMGAAGLDYYEGESPGPFTGDSEAERLAAVKLAYSLDPTSLNDKTHFGDYPMINRPGSKLSLISYPENIDALLDTGVGDLRFDGCTALMGAVMSDQPSIVQFLLDQSADINIKSRLGWTAEMVAQNILLGNTQMEFPIAEKMIRKAAAERAAAAGTSPAPVAAAQTAPAPSEALK